MTDKLGRTTTSVVDSANLVDNSPLKGADVQAVNGGATLSKAEAGDTFTFTYSSQIDTTKVVSGWTGAARDVTVRIRDGGQLFRTGKDDTLDVLVNGNVINLGSVNLKGNYVQTLLSVQFNATMTASTVTMPNGVVRSTVTLKLGSLSSGSASRLKTSGSNAAMVWTPSSAVTDLQGRACSTATVTETGTLDKDF